MTIDSSGNVGIGDETPDATFDVEQSGGSAEIARFEQTSPGTNQQLTLAAPSGNNPNLGFEEGGVLQAQIRWDGASDLLKFTTNGSVNNVMTLTDDRDVGFGGLQTTGADDEACFDTGGLNSEELVRVEDDTCGSSSERFKTDISDLSYGLEEVLAIKPRFFRYKESYKPGFQLLRTGFIAEEMAEVVPEVITYEDYDENGLPTGEIKGIDYEKFTAVNTRAIQEIGLRLGIAGGAPTTTPSVYIAADGNVGVGTTSPSSTLAVDGEVSAKSFVNVSTRTIKSDIRELPEKTLKNFYEDMKGLRIVSYEYTNTTASSSRQLGLIAEEAPEAIQSAAGKGVDLYKYITFIAGSVQELAKQIDTLSAKVKNGFEGLVAGRLVAKEELCVGDTCVTESELKQLLEQQAQSNTATTASTTAPTITITGNNPATVDIGASYSDLGATVTDDKDDNLGYDVRVRELSLSEPVGTSTTATELEEIAKTASTSPWQGTLSLNTDAPATYQIAYTAEDNDGNAATSSRFVIIGDGAGAETQEEETQNADTQSTDEETSTTTNERRQTNDEQQTTNEQSSATTDTATTTNATTDTISATTTDNGTDGAADDTTESADTTADDSLLEQTTTATSTESGVEEEASTTSQTDTSTVTATTTATSTDSSEN